MRNKSLISWALISALAVFLLASAPEVRAAQRSKALLGLDSARDRDERHLEALKEPSTHYPFPARHSQPSTTSI